MEINTDVANNGTGATGFSSLNRGIANASYPVVATVSQTPMGGGRMVVPVQSIGVDRGGDGRPVEFPRTVSTRERISRDATGRAVETIRTVSTRAPIEARDTGGRILDNSGGLSSPNVPTNPGVNQPKSPLDMRIEDLFRGFFNEPIRGSADKSGEFVYIPPASGGGSNTGMLFLLLAGAGIVGYVAYRKFAGGN